MYTLNQAAEFAGAPGGRALSLSFIVAARFFVRILDADCKSDSAA